jgi:hypothetical protein
MEPVSPPRSVVIVKAIAWIEISIGIATVLSLAVSALFFHTEKSANVFMFVLASALTSSALGAGLLRRNNLFRKLLIFFSGYVILIKFLVFIGILHFTGELITAISDPVKNSISIIYHIFVIIILSREPSNKDFFVKGVKDA